MKRVFIFLLQLLLGGLVVHFFAHTIVTYGLWFSLTWMWAWKELMVLWLSLMLGVLLLRRVMVPMKKSWLYGVGLLLVMLLWSAVVSFWVHQQPFFDWMVAMRYDFFPFVTLLVVRGLFLLQPISTKSLFSWFLNLLKIIVSVSLVWYLIVSLVPQWTEWLWYSLEARQRWINAEPPVRYLTNVWWWYIRNQWLFGWPVSWGLYLLVFWPLFFVKEVTSLHSTRRYMPYFWLFVYTGSVVLTFSRVVWFAFLVESLAIVLMLYGTWTIVSLIKKSWKVCVSVLLWIVGSVALIGFLWPADVPVAENRDQGLWQRELSDKGHVELLLEWFDHIAVYPFYGWGAGAAWPASYRVDREVDVDEVEIEVNQEDASAESFFNTENQYLQIGVEWWLVGLLFYLLLLLYILWLCFQWYQKTQPESRGGVVSFWLGVGFLWLMAAGMLQHSLVDVQVMMSLMVVMGIALWEKTLS
jgi:hypothetical protein